MTAWNRMKKRQSVGKWKTEKTEEETRMEWIFLFSARTKTFSTFVCAYTYRFSLRTPRSTNCMVLKANSLEFSFDSIALTAKIVCCSVGTYCGGTPLSRCRAFYYFRKKTKRFFFYLTLAYVWYTRHTWHAAQMAIVASSLEYGWWEK